MNKLPALFTDQSALHAAFTGGLSRMLDSSGLGNFILVLANASYDPVIYQALEQRLYDEYLKLAKHQSGNDKAEPADRQVFARLVATGLEQLHTRQVRQLGPWSIQFNQLRSFRPTRMSEVYLDSIRSPFNPDGFHFNRAFLENETLWQGQLAGSYCRLLYNKFPFADYHSILVIEPADKLPQFLSQAAHEYIWGLGESLGDRLPAIGFGYNAYGAGASVNHQHFQMYVRQNGVYPVEDKHWQHNGGEEAYPLYCYREASCDAAWRMIAQLHDANITYNLIYRPGLMYIIPRRFQGQFEFADWMTGMGWADVAGEVTAYTREDYARIDRTELENQLRRAKLQDMR